MESSDPREVIVVFLSAPQHVTTETTSAGGWVARAWSSGLDALPESIEFVKERSLPQRAAYNVRFTTRQGRRMRFTVSLVQAEDGAWQVMGGAGGGADEAMRGAPTRGHPWANLGGGGWPSAFYAGGAVLEDGETVTRVRLRSANGTEMEDTVDDGEVLFLTDDEIQTPVQVELYDAAGNLVGRHTTFSF